MPDDGPTRRQVLTRLGWGAVAASMPAALLTACTGDGDGSPGPVASPTPTADPDEPVRRRAAAAEQDLLVRYDAAIAAQPSLEAVLRPLADEHAAHLAALTTAAGGAGTATAPSPGSTATSSAGSTAPPAPRASDAVVKDLTAAERAAAAARAEDTLAASPALARLLAGIGASEAVHAALLPGSRASGPR